MSKLIEGKTYLINYQKKDGSIRPILCTIDLIPVGSSCFFVKELVKGEASPKTLLYSGVLSFVCAKQKTSVVKNKFKIVKTGNKYVVSLVDTVVGVVYSVGQVERLIETHLKYNLIKEK